MSSLLYQLLQHKSRKIMPHGWVATVLAATAAPRAGSSAARVRLCSSLCSNLQLCTGEHVRDDCPGRRGRLRTLSDLLCLNQFCMGLFVWARRALKHQKNWFPARAVMQNTTLAAQWPGLQGGPPHPRISKVKKKYSTSITRTFLLLWP